MALGVRRLWRCLWLAVLPIPFHCHFVLDLFFSLGKSSLRRIVQ
jgi:hypothetical protein